MMKRKVGTVTLAGSLIAAGIVLFAQNFTNITIKDLFKYWPVLLIALGIEMVIFMLAQNRENGEVKFGIDGFCIALIIIAAVFSNSASFINFDIPFEFNFNGNNLMEGIRYNTSIKEEVKKENISSSYSIETLKIRNTFGNIEIKKTNESSIRIEASVEVKCKDIDEATEYAKNAIVIEEGITTEIYTKELSSSEKHDYANAKINYIVYVPQNTKVEIHGSHGDIEVDGVNGDVKVENSFGETRVKNIGGNVTVNNSFGEIILNDIKGEVIADNKNGRISASNIQKLTNLETAFGEIEAEAITGGLIAVSKNGKITAKNISGKTELESYFGEVDIEDITGDVTATSKNGAIKAENIIGNTRLETSFGNIKLDSKNVNNGIIYAETSFGNIDTELLLNREKSNSKVIIQGNTGNGQYKIDLVTSNGSIDIK